MFMNFYYDTDELAFDAKVHKAKLVSTIKPTQLNVIQEDIFLVPFMNCNIQELILDSKRIAFDTKVHK
jgi:hypothetical protein